ncbi:phage head morphogenesis protein, partial [Sebaldella sp. S0638]|nr:phage head morphogenesis protein [Sebaldella sp. S0638]
MYNDIHVNTAIESLLRGVASRELIFKSEITDKEEDTILLELQKRFNRIKNKTNFIKEIGKACFFGYTLHEIEYNEDFSMRRFVSIPRNKMEFDKEKKKWKIKGKEEVYVEENGKWLISIYDESIENFKGNTKLRAVYKTYQEIEEIKKKVNAIVEKYGSVIPVFAYNTKLSDEEVKEAAKEIKAMYGEKILAVPLEDGNLKDNFFFITLNDLDIHIHNTLIEKAESKIFQNLLGGTLTVSTGEGSNSYALGKVHETEKEKIENEISLFIRDELDKLIEIDGNIFGYESEQYYISIELPEDREKILQIENLEEDKMNKKADTISKL